MKVYLILLLVTMGFTPPTPSDVLADAIAWGEQHANPNATDAFALANEHGQYRNLIRFVEPGILPATPGRVTGEPFDAQSRQARAHREFLITRQTEHRQSMERVLDRALDVTHYYLITHSGMAVWLTPGEAEMVADLSGVASVRREQLYELATHASPWFIGADTLWNGDNMPENVELRGENMVIGILDTGVDPAHPSFLNDSACGHGQNGVADKLLSFLDCGSTDANGICNGTGPVDSHGHGSHVASTAAGNRVDAAAEPPPQPPGSFAEISGIAPCAHIRSYKVCPNDSCTGSAIMAALESVLIHGDVDVVNYSISGGIDPWNDLDRPKLDLVDAGVFVAAAAGNFTGAGPAGQVHHRAPWLLSVAAASHDGMGTHGLLSAAGPGTPPGEVQDIAAIAGSESPAAPELLGLPIRHFEGQDPSAEACDDQPAFPDGHFENAAALILRGTCPFAEKIGNAFNAGAELVIIYDNAPGDPFIMNTAGQPDIPAYLIPQAEGQALQAFVSNHPDAATIDLEPVIGDVLAGFSLRGPTPHPLLNLTKPDIAAPGTAVYAAVPQVVIPEGYAVVAGTSMASPHIAGAAALMRQAHPEWTVPELMSALMTTAKTTGRKENLVDAWDPDDIGGGRVDLTKAALAGLVMDETVQNYLDADPAGGGDVRTLNTASLRDMNCFGSCTWTRTVRNTLAVPTEWTTQGLVEAASAANSAVGRPAVADNLDGETPPFQITIEPETFEFTGHPGETQELTITVTPLENLLGAITFGGVEFTETSAHAPDQHLTVAIRGRPAQPVVTLDPIRLTAELFAGETDRTLTITNSGEETLEWTLTEEVDSSFRSSAGDTNCDHEPGILINDTGVVDNGYRSSSNFEQVMLLDRYTPDLIPAEFTAVCIAFFGRPGRPETLQIEIVVFADDGPDGAPGTELGAMAAAIEEMPEVFVPTPQWVSFDLSPLNITVDAGSPYVGVRWANEEHAFLAADESSLNPPGHAGGWWWVGPHDIWLPMDQVLINYRALFVRPVTELGPLDCGLPDWIGVPVSGGTAAPGSEQTLEISFDAAGLEPGTYTASLCLETNAPNRPLAAVPLTLTVVDADTVFRDRFEQNPSPVNWTK